MAAKQMKRKGTTTIGSRGAARPKRETSARRLEAKARAAAPPATDGGTGRQVAPLRPFVSLGARDPLEHCRALIRDIPDFPTPGILFKDITPLLADPRAFHIVLDSLAERYIGEHIDAVVGIEARGFIFGGALAARLNASFVPARKPGKLPALSDRVTYKTEYSLAELEMHKDSLPEESRVIIVDDVLATGGTAKAAAELVRKQNAHVFGFAFVIELSFLGGRERLLPVKAESVLTY
jgi:adenine phosphoribosyltransferase